MIERFEKILYLENPQINDINELKKLYDLIFLKDIKKLINNIDPNIRNKKGFQKCFIELIPYFSKELINQNDFKEDLAILYIKNININLLKYSKGIIIGMITNPKVKFSKETVELYLNKILEKYKKPIYKEFTKENINLIIKLRSDLDNQNKEKTYKIWENVFLKILIS